MPECLFLGPKTMRLFRRSTPAESMSDEQLLAEYRSSGSVRYLGVLYERYMPMVYGVCLKILKDAGKSEDATMAIYEELVKKIPEHQVEHFRGWLYVMARNHCLMEWRKNKRHQVQSMAPEDMNRFDDAEEAFDFELPSDHSPLEKCMETLNEAQRQAVKLFYFEDLSYKDIATLQGEELGKVRSNIQNGKRNLKNCLEGA